MAEGAEDDDKTEEPTQKRIEDARNRGEIVYSTEVGTAFSLLAVTMIVAFMAAPMAGEIGTAMRGALSNAHQLPADGRALMTLYAAIGLKMLAIIGMAALALVGAGIAARFVQDQPVWSAKRLEPKLERLNPFEGAKRVFGKQAAGTFGKTLLKLTIVGVAVVWSLWPRDGTLASLPTLDVGALAPYMRERALSLLIGCTIAATGIAIIDYIFVRQAHYKRLRMTRHEMKEEFRQSEGDPHVRAKLRQIRQERAKKRMMSAVPSATVIITNPTHYAVALKYDREESPAPICVAKGVNEVALRIREVATENGVAIIEDPPLARALYATADIDEAIPREHFEAVAKVIGYVLRLADRRRR
ncbi:MAG: flagellar biosynthetic protein FlhB [Alphaproteobacteria bacterium]|nr:MAG: flagellar biosynthetic protein FlhB [Caulobacteraceae bacterium]TPW05852.1 MAG: flagellar biosynthetic protein FlhB [Alphaproteobacteria bacterium]